MQLTGIGLLPSDLGIKVARDSWRPNQLETIESVINSTKKVIVIQAPTGSGKSVVAQSVLNILGSHGLILTKTKELQYQYEQANLVGLYGRDNYVCNRFPIASAANGVCHIGQSCRLRAGGCDYYDQKRLALAARISILNYSYFFLEANGPGEFSNRDWIIADEAHSLPDELSRAYTIKISHADCRKLAISIPPITNRVDINKWREWARNVSGKILGLSKYATGDRARILQNIRSATIFLSILSDNAVSNWVAETDRFKTIIRPIWVEHLAREYLWRHANKFLLMSATINPTQVLVELGVDQKDADIFIVASHFPVENHPIRYWPTAKVNRSITNQEFEAIVENVISICSKYRGRGIIHCGSYDFGEKLSKAIQSHGEFSGSNFGMAQRFLRHNRAERENVIAEFKKSDERNFGSQQSRNIGSSRESQSQNQTRPENGKILISPSITEGLDFPYELCEFQIIVRLPFPNRGDPVWVARINSDKHKGESAYTNNTISTIVQAVGRGMRASDDVCITYILDSNFSWVYNRNLSQFPRHFRDALRTITNV